MRCFYAFDRNSLSPGTSSTVPGCRPGEAHGSSCGSTRGGSSPCREMVGTSPRPSKPRRILVQKSHTWTLSPISALMFLTSIFRSWLNRIHSIRLLVSGYTRDRLVPRLSWMLRVTVFRSLSVGTGLWWVVLLRSTQSCGRPSIQHYCWK